MNDDRKKLIDFSAIIVAVFSLIVATFSYMANVRANAISNGLIELQVYQSIDTAENRIIAFAGESMSALSKKTQCVCSNRNVVKDEVLNKIMHSRLIALNKARLNAYECACSRYLAGRIDQKLFEKDYKNAINELFRDTHSCKLLKEKDDNDEYKYDSIHEVSEGWGIKVK